MLLANDFWVFYDVLLAKPDTPPPLTHTQMDLKEKGQG